jgi:hypothetical protein
MLRAIERPRPLPSPAGLAVKEGSKMRAASAAAMPGRGPLAPGPPRRRVQALELALPPPHVALRREGGVEEQQLLERDEGALAARRLGGEALADERRPVGLSVVEVGDALL